MKHLYHHILFLILPAIASLALLPGCGNVLYDDEGDCDPVHIIRFTYDWNLHFNDIFPGEVPSVNLYVFDSEGKLVRTVSEVVPPRAEAKNYKIELRGLTPGYYSFLAWCGVKDSEHFSVNPNEVALPAMEHHICRINSLDEGDGDGHVHKDIFRLFHGRLDNEDLTADEGTHEHVINLKKDTNVIRVVLQHMNGAPMDKNDYSFRIVDDNGLYDHNNDLLPHKTIVYHPHHIDSATATFFPEDDPTKKENETRAISNVSAVVAQFTVGRMMMENYETARLIVNAKDGHEIFNIRLLEYALLARNHYYDEDGITPLEPQDYLDRQDEYPMTFFLDQSHEWIKTIIYINDWRVVRDNPTIH